MALPPTSTQGSGDANPVTTFTIVAPNIPITHAGVVATIGTIPTAGGGTGLTSAGANGNVLTSVAGVWVSTAAPPSVGIGARYFTAAGQSVASGGAVIIDFGTQGFDTNSRVTTGVNWRFTADTATAGLYSVSATISATQISGADFRAEIWKNGSLYGVLGYGVGPSGGSGVVTASGNDLVQLANTDYVDIRAVVSTSLSLLTNASFNHVSIGRIGT